MPQELLTPILDGGIENVHFFEGRLLSARDLREEQRAQRTHRERLGRALGAGIVSGLEVEVAVDGADGRPPALRIARGLAINPAGQTLELPAEQVLSLVRAVPGLEPEAGLFHDCNHPPETQVPVGVGVYLLVTSPVSGYRELAPQSGLGAGGKVIGCGRRYAVEGLQFRLEQLLPAQLTGISETTRALLVELLGRDDLAGRSRLRNLLAHLCLGTEARRGFARDPLALTAAGTSPFAAHGALDDLRRLGALSDCDVPLALFSWTLEGISFLDLWSVRRRPLPVEAEAAFLQFQEQLEWLLALHPSPPTLQAREHLVYLPAVGVLPLQGPGRARGLDLAIFLSGKTWRVPELFLEGARLPELLEQGRRYPPVALDDPEMLWVYLVRENRPPEGAAPPPYAVFTSGYVPFAAEARCDLARFDFSNFGLI